MTTALPAATDFTSASTQGAAKTAYAAQRQFLADLLGTSGLAADARTALGLGTIATQAASAVAITGGAIDGTTLGATTRATARVTTLDASGAITMAGRLNVGTSTVSATPGNGNGQITAYAVGGMSLLGQGSSYDLSLLNSAGTGVLLVPTGTQRAYFQGAVLGGGVTGNVHQFDGAVTANAGNPIFAHSQNNSTVSAYFYAVSGAGYSAANTAMALQKDTGTNRSINAAGTINASGADLAEYRLTGEIRMPVAKGQVIGYQADGKVTDKWSLSVAQSRWQIKTTNPHVVGGDAWATEDIIGKRPMEPELVLPTYDGPILPEEPMTMPVLVLPEQPPEPVRQNDEDDATFKVRLATWRDESARVEARSVEAQAAYVQIQSMHDQLVASYQDALRTWQQEQQTFAARVEAARYNFETITLVTHQNDRAAWEARLEAQRQTVDRIAYNGEVPMITGQAKPKKAGDRVVPIEGPDDTIDVKFVDPGDIEFRDYVRCCGTVTSVREDGSCIVAVKVG